MLIDMGLGVLIKSCMKTRDLLVHLVQSLGKENLGGIGVKIFSI